MRPRPWGCPPVPPRPRGAAAGAGSAPGDGRTRQRPGEDGLVGDGPFQACSEQERKDVLADGLFRAPHAPRGFTENAFMLLQSACDLLRGVLGVREAARGKDGVAGGDAGAVAVDEQGKDGVEVGGGGELYLTAGGGFPIGRERAGQDIGLDLDEDLLVFLGEVAAPARQPEQGLDGQSPGVEPGQVEPDLQVAELGDGEGGGALFPGVGRVRVSLVRQLEIAGMRTSPGMVGALAHALHDESPFGRGQLGRRLQGVVPIGIGEVPRSIVLQLLHERGDEVEALVEGRVVDEGLHHVEVVLESMHACPGHAENAGPRRPVVGLMHVPDEGYV